MIGVRKIRRGGGKAWTKNAMSHWIDGVFSRKIEKIEKYIEKYSIKFSKDRNEGYFPEQMSFDFKKSIECRKKYTEIEKISLGDLKAIFRK